MKKAAILFLGTLASVATFTVASASNTDDLGNVKAGDFYPYIFTSTKPPAAFTDFVDFDLKTAASVADFVLDFGVKNFSVQLQESCGTSCWTNVGGSSTVPYDNYGGLSAGDYRLDITGKTTGPKGTSSLVLGELSVAAVPEPSTLAMILAGAGLLAVYQWRRRGKSGGQSLSGAA
jgi:PEP-CTERM motif